VTGEENSKKSTIKRGSQRGGSRIKVSQAREEDFIGNMVSYYTCLIIVGIFVRKKAREILGD